MRPITVTAGPLTKADATAICKSQTPTAGALTLDGSLVVDGVAVMDAPRRVLITTVGDESAATFSIYGLMGNTEISETMTGPNKTTGQSVLDYDEVTKIDTNKNATKALTVGTSGVGGSHWVRFDDWAPSTIGIQCTADGTVDFTVQQTLDDPNSPTNPVEPQNMAWVNHPDSSLVAATSTVQGNYAYPPTWTRIVLNSGDGEVTGTFLQASNGPV